MTTIEQLISDLEWKFAVALVKSREDGDPKHRKGVIAEAQVDLLKIALKIIGPNEPEDVEYDEAVGKQTDLAIVIRNQRNDELRQAFRKAFGGQDG